MPHAATDDYMTKFAEYVKDHLDPSLPIYLEYSNEAWNGRFDANKWLSQVHDGNGWSYYGQHAAHAFEVWHTVFGSERNRVKRVLSGQKKNPGVLNKAIEKCQEAGGDFDFGSCTSYWPTATGVNFQADGSGVPQAFLEDINDPNSETNELIAKHADRSSEEGKGFVSYEGGPAGPSGAIASAVLVKGHRHPDMEPVMEAFLKNLEDHGMDLHMHFLLSQPWEESVGKADFQPWALMGGMWGDIEKDYKYQGVLNYLGVNFKEPTYPYPNAVPLIVPGESSTITEKVAETTAKSLRLRTTANPRTYSITGRLVKTANHDRANSHSILIRVDGNCSARAVVPAR
jgi:hypothetical protein